MCVCVRVCVVCACVRVRLYFLCLSSLRNGGLTFSKRRSLPLSFLFLSCTTLSLSLSVSLSLSFLSLRLSFPEAMCLFLTVHLLVRAFQLQTAPLFAALTQVFSSFHSFVFPPLSSPLLTLLFPSFAAVMPAARAFVLPEKEYFLFFLSSAFKCQVIESS